MMLPVETLKHHLTKKPDHFMFQKVYCQVIQKNPRFKSINQISVNKRNTQMSNTVNLMQPVENLKHLTKNPK